MNPSSYNLTIYDRLLHDYSADIDAQDIDVLVASGDCFITLATQLDATLNIATPDAVTIEQVIKALLYLQHRYKIVKKPQAYTQK